MPIFHTQNVLNGGEISPLLRGRVDQPRYNTGAREMLNMVPMPQGRGNSQAGDAVSGYGEESNVTSGSIRVQ